jgi:hypothetical protein
MYACISPRTVLFQIAVYASVTGEKRYADMLYVYMSWPRPGPTVQIGVHTIYKLAMMCSCGGSSGQINCPKI